MLSTFELELTDRERVNAQPSQEGHKKSHHTHSALLSGSRTTKPDPFCCYCQQSHPSSSCTTVTKSSDRKQILKSKGRCFSCLHMGHISRECRSSSRCHKCQKRHHTSICDSNFSQNQQVNSPYSTGSGQKSKIPASQPTQPTSALFPQPTSCVSPNACAVIHLPGGSHSCLRIRLILDGGSQRSYLSERARNVLKLQSTGSQSLSIATFGSNRSSIKVCPVVEVGLQLRGYPSMMLSVYVVPNNCVWNAKRVNNRCNKIIRLFHSMLRLSTAFAIECCNHRLLLQSMIGGLIIGRSIIDDTSIDGRSSMIGRSITVDHSHVDRLRDHRFDRTIIDSIVQSSIDRTINRSHNHRSHNHRSIAQSSIDRTIIDRSHNHRLIAQSLIDRTIIDRSHNHRSSNETPDDRIV